MSTPVVLVHGLGGSPAAWGRVMALLAPHTGPITAPLLAGEESIGAEADRIAGMLTQRGRHPAVVAGHSMGGLVATALAERAPHLVERIVLLNSPPTSQSRISARGAGERLLALPLLGPLAWHLMPRAVAAKGLAGAFAPGTTVPEVFVDDLRNTGLHAFLRSTRAIDTYLSTQPLPARLATLACPTHVVFGMQDQRVDPGSVDDYRHVPGLTVTTLPDAGHSPNWEQPAATASAILTPSHCTPSQ
jgi:pimeloyl-ACP methyl ester carboxylesterase